jgi:hypothetical protein
VRSEPAEILFFDHNDYLISTTFENALTYQLDAEFGASTHIVSFTIWVKLPGSARILSKKANAKSKTIGENDLINDGEDEEGNHDEEIVDPEETVNRRVLSTDIYETIPYTKESLPNSALSESRFEALATTQDMTLFMSLDGNSLSETNRRR